MTPKPTPKPSIPSFRHSSALKFLFILGSLFLQGSQAMAENSSHFLLGETVIITEKNASDLPKVIERFNKESGTLIIDSSVKKGAMPVKPTSKTRIIDTPAESISSEAITQDFRAFGRNTQALIQALDGTLSFQTSSPLMPRSNLGRGNRSRRTPLTPTRAKTPRNTQTPTTITRTF